MNELPVRAIRPNPTQPRKRFNEKALEELAQSLVRHGMIQPIVVRPRDGYYEIIAGERRYQAASRAGFERVPVLVIEADETRVMELALIENIQRADLSAIEEAMAYAEMIEEFGITQAELAQRVGKSVRISRTVFGYYNCHYSFNKPSWMSGYRWDMPVPYCL